jgi:hypothetical protein
MTIRTHLAFLVGSFATVAVVDGQLPATSATTIHVSPHGNDAAPGTAQQPVASLARAQVLTRQARTAGQAVSVTLRGGIYYLPETVVFTPVDSGTAATPVIWRAAAGETPVLSGGSRHALSWRSSSLRPDVFEATVAAGLEIDQLWVNGQRQWMARFPNRESGEGLNVFDTWKLDHRAPLDPARNPLAPERIARWADPTGAYFHAMHPALWGGVHWRVTGKTPDSTLALVGGTQNNRGARMHHTYRMIENIREELDAPGEWFHDRATPSSITTSASTQPTSTAPPAPSPMISPPIAWSRIASSPARAASKNKPPASTSTWRRTSRAATARSMMCRAPASTSAAAPGAAT